MKKRLQFFVASCVLLSACSRGQPDSAADNAEGQAATTARAQANSADTAASAASRPRDVVGAAVGGAGARDEAAARSGNAAGTSPRAGTAAQGGIAAGIAGTAGMGDAGRTAANSGIGVAAGVGGVGAIAAQGGIGAGIGGTAAVGDAGATAARLSQGGNAAGTGPRGGMAGHVADTTSGQMFKACPTDGSLCKIMPFGDSITDGYNQDTPGGYRIELFRRAHSAGKNITFVGSGSNGPEKVDGVPFPHNHEGHSGWTIAPAGGRSGISTLVSMVMPQFKPHIVLLMIGTNDAIDNYEMAKAPERLGQLIDSIYAQLPAVTIIVAQLIPARGASNQGDDAQLNSRIQAFNQAIPSVVDTRASAGKHIIAVDMFTPYASAQRSMFEDQWHPNADGYALIGSTWYTALEPLL